MGRVCGGSDGSLVLPVADGATPPDDWATEDDAGFPAVLDTALLPIASRSMAPVAPGVLFPLGAPGQYGPRSICDRLPVSAATLPVLPPPLPADIAASAAAIRSSKSFAEREAPSAIAAAAAPRV
jgi:hypothetical protein